jgi:DNA-directed RNA polymerase specialized sigma24 family protein
VARKGSGDNKRTDQGEDALVQIMRRLAAGDQAAVVTLYERYGGPIAAAVRRTARSRPGRLDRDDVDGLVFEVCFELAAVAAAWSPAGGALPWVWARHRVANVVDRVLGIVVEPLDDERLPGPDAVAAGGAAEVEAGAEAQTGGGSLLDTLGRLAPDLASARLLAEALDRGRVSRRDGALLLEYAYEKHSGNASPAATVAPVFGMKEVSVRQAARRARQRLLRLAATEERFAPLAELPLLV